MSSRVFSSTDRSCLRTLAGKVCCGMTGSRLDQVSRGGSCRIGFCEIAFTAGMRPMNVAMSSRDIWDQSSG